MEKEIPNELARALAKAQGQMKPAEKTGFNEHRKYHYVELAGIVGAARKPLAENGLSFVQYFESHGESDYLITMLLHESGQSLRSRLKLLPTNDYHALGSAVTYSRKYALASMLGIVAEGEDDDGEAAMASPAKNAGPKAGAKARPGRKPKPSPKEAPKTPDEQWVEALAIIDKVEGARAMFEAKDIDCRELLPQVVKQVLELGEEGMQKKVEKFKKELAAKEEEK